MKKRILVVVDMQKDFITGPLGNAECAKAVDKVVDVINNGDYDEIFFTMDTHQENYLETQEGKKLQVTHCVQNTDGWKLDTRVDKAICNFRNTGKTTVCFLKETFGSIDLANYITKHDLNDPDVQFDFVGVCTGICVISNVVMTKAAAPEAPIRVIKDACACVTPDSHQTALNAMALLQVELV